MVIFLLTVILIFLRIINFKRFYLNKNKIIFNTYECRYVDINYWGIIYSSQFFILALSFMLFDLEIVFFLPYFVIFYYSFFVVYILIFFLVFLLFRLYYELIQKIV